MSKEREREREREKERERELGHCLFRIISKMHQRVISS